MLCTTMKPRATFLCKKCGNTLKSQSKWEAHIDPNRKTACDAHINRVRVLCTGGCGETFYDKSTMKVHLQNTCKGTPPQSIEEYKEQNDKLHRELQESRRKNASFQNDAEELRKLRYKVEELEGVVKSSKAFGLLFPTALTAPTQTNVQAPSLSTTITGDNNVVNQTIINNISPQGTISVFDVLNNENGVIGAIIRDIYCHPQDKDGFNLHLDSRDPLCFSKSIANIDGTTSRRTVNTNRTLRNAKEDISTEYTKSFQKWRADCPADHMNKLIKAEEIYKRSKNENTQNPERDLEEMMIIDAVDFYSK